MRFWVVNRDNFLKTALIVDLFGLFRRLSIAKHCFSTVFVRFIALLLYNSIEKGPGSNDCSIR